jgi:hypothetical protein
MSTNIFSYVSPRIGREVPFTLKKLFHPEIEISP